MYKKMVAYRIRTHGLQIKKKKLYLVSFHGFSLYIILNIYEKGKCIAQKLYNVKAFVLNVQ